MAKTAERGAALRSSVATVAAQLDVHPQTVYALIREGVLRGIYPHGKGPGKRVYLDAEEVRLYALGGPAAAAEYRAKNKRR